MTYCLRDYEKALKECGLLLKSTVKDNLKVTGLTFDSREVATGTLFICKGAAFKREYLDMAEEKGAIACVSGTEYSDFPCITVSDIRRAMAVLANMYYDEPWKKLKLTGFGGTKGKSTSAYYMKAITDDYMKATGGKESAIISSIDTYDGVIREESHITTPEAVELQMHLANAVQSGITWAQMEISSQALKYDRVAEMRFDVGVFLNISEDHISPLEHRDFDDYFNSKMMMFPITDTAAVNLDCDLACKVLERAESAKKVVTFSRRDERADYFAYDIKKSGHGSSFRIRHGDFDGEFTLTMPGLFNVENALGAAAAACEQGIPWEYIRSGLERARSGGRMELYSSADGNIIAIVDYAHNKLSFETLFSSMAAEYPGYNMVAVFGCPGKKALSRRRDLGTIAGRYSKKVIITAEDPGEEPFAGISHEIEQYVHSAGASCEIIEDRGQAIKRAIDTAEGKTIILITGKGRETRQKYGREYIPCPSDVDYATRYLAEYDGRV